MVKHAIEWCLSCLHLYLAYTVRLICVFTLSDFTRSSRCVHVVESGPPDCSAAEQPTPADLTLTAQGEVEKKQEKKTNQALTLLQ